MRVPLYAAGLATGASFGVLFTGGVLPYLLGAALVALLVGSAGPYRFVLLFPAAALYVVLAVYRTLPLTPGGWRGLLDQIGRDVSGAAQVVYAQPVPYDPLPGLLVFLVPIIVITVAFATSATLYEESPIVSVAVLGLTIGTLSTVSFEVGAAPFFAAFLVCAVALLLITGGGARRGGRGATGPSPRPAAVFGGGMVVLLVLALPALPVASEAIQPAMVDWTKIGTGGTSRLAVEADVGDYLTTGRDADLMLVESPEPLLWRGGTLDYFDGFRWSSTTASGEDDGDEVAAGVPTRDVVQEVRVLQAETNLLFGGYRVTSVSARDASERPDGSWASARSFTEGDTYRVLSRVPQPTAAQLELAGTDYPLAVRERFFQLPEDRPEVLRETAEEIMATYDPQTPYATARAIERYLSRDGGFVYNINADYTRGDKAIEEFLGGDRQGFCTQFATSMALLARELGVPSRVVYGATTGREEKPNSYLVTGYNMHTWVEIYFPGVGWYPFEPTPGFAVPNTMEANAPRPELPREGGGNVSETPQTQDQQPPAPKEEAGTGERGAVPEPSPLLYASLSMLLLALLAAAVPLLKRALAARGRPDDLYKDLVGRLRDVPSGGGKIGSADSPALTPTERLLLLAGSVGVEEEPFREFARAYSESLYAPGAPSGGASGAARPAMAHAYRRALREYGEIPVWRRALGAANPSSLLSRARRSLGAYYRKGIGGALRAKIGRRGE